MAAAAAVNRLSICAREGWWPECLDLSAELEAEMTPASPVAAVDAAGMIMSAAAAPSPDDSLAGLPASLMPQLRAHYLVVTVLALNHLGEGSRCATRIKELHALLDAEGEGGAGNGGSMAGLGGGLLEVRPLLSFVRHLNFSV